MRVSYLGPKGSFSQIALTNYFGDDLVQVSQKTIGDVFRSVELNNSDYGIVPIENSFEGSVNNTHDLLIGSDIQVYDEIQIRINQCLVAKTHDISEIEMIYSHPQSFGQCQKWLRNNLPNAQLIPVLSNSDGAERITSNNEACIGSKTLANLYSLNLLNENIEDSKENTTRFVILSHTQQDKSDNSKISLIITPPNSDASGSLYKLLKPFATEDINLLRIESRPLRGQLWRYVFFIDCEGHIDDKNIQNAMNALDDQDINVKILGCYPSYKSS